MASTQSLSVPDPSQSSRTVREPVPTDTNPPRAGNDSTRHDSLVEVVTDRDLARAAEAELRLSSYEALRRVACEFHDGHLTLRGRVATYYLKQVAQSTLRDFVGAHAAIARIDNQIEVFVLTPK